MRRRRLSIPTRVFLGFAAVLLAFASVVGTSLVQHERTAQNLRIIHEGYLPLALTLGEAKATQAVFATLLDRVMEDRGTASRSWLHAARRVRPATLRRAIHGLERAERLTGNPGTDSGLAEVREDLELVGQAYEQGQADLDLFFKALDHHEEARAQGLLLRLRARERVIQESFRDASRAMQERIAVASAHAAEQERRAGVVLLAMTSLALLVGVAFTIWSQRLLQPIPRLHERVEAIARGEESRALEPRSDDEIGQLTAAFERMVSALALRDQRLREAVEAQLETKNRLIESERLAAIGRMAAHVTHEVRNPLSSIGLNVEMLEDEVPELNEEARALLRAVHREIDRLTEITEEYLQLARVPEPRLVAMELEEMLDDLVDFVRPELSAAGVTLRLSVPPGLPTVAVDQQQLRQALLNLLRNAREATPEGGSVEVSVVEEPGGVAIAVRDSGVGMEADVRARIFDMFYSTKRRGTGLGLALTQQIIVAHGGEIRCESSPGEGTTFTISLPSTLPVDLP